MALSLPQVVIVSFLGVALLISGGVAHAKPGQLTGDDFLRYCVRTSRTDLAPDSKYGRQMVTYCAGYVEASVNIVARLNRCIPGTMKPADIVLVTYDFLKSHPEAADELLVDTIIKAVDQQWPCG